MRLRLLLIATVAALVLVPSGTAAETAPDKPVSSPPMKPPPDPRQSSVLRAGGLAVTWPLRGARVTLYTGEPISVRVRQEGEAPQAARVSFARVNARGRAADTIAAARLRDGRFSVRVPEAKDGARFRLRVTVGGWTHSTVVRARLDCVRPAWEGRIAATLQLDRSSARTGETLSTTLRNTGTTCLTMGLGFSWERRTAAGAWEPVTTVPGLPVPAIGLSLLPGRTHEEEWPVQEELTPGTYRLVKQVAPQKRGAANRTIASGSLTVLAP